MFTDFFFVKLEVLFVQMQHGYFEFDIDDQVKYREGLCDNRRNPCTKDIRMKPQNKDEL